LYFTSLKFHNSLCPTSLRHCREGIRTWILFPYVIRVFVVGDIYERTLNGELKIAFSVWNIGEVLGVLDRYFKRKWLEKKDYEMAHLQFIGETLRLIRLKLVKIIPLRTKLLIPTWNPAEKYQIYQADALQITSAKYIDASSFLTGDKRLYEVATEEGLNSIYLG